MRILTDILAIHFKIDRRDLMKMARDYGRKIGFEGTFLKEYGLDKDFKMNIEANHATLAMYEILKNGGLPVGINFDSKNRRPSNTYEDMFHAFILGMDSFAYGLIKAAAMIEDGRPVSGRQEYLESVLNNIILSNN